MALSPDIRERILAAIRDKAGLMRNCVTCGTNRWAIADGFLSFVIQDEPHGPLQLTGRQMPCAAAVCQQCGNTLFFNLLVLGLEDIFAGEAEAAVR